MKELDFKQLDFSLATTEEIIKELTSRAKDKRKYNINQASIFTAEVL